MIVEYVPGDVGQVGDGGSSIPPGRFATGHGMKQGLEGGLLPLPFVDVRQ